VPGKNLKLLDGLSLVGYKARSALKSRFCSRLIISTDGEDIQEEARRHGVETPFLRPAHLATDTATSNDVVKHVINYCETVENRRYDAIMLLEPSSPFADGSDYDAAIELFIERNAALVLGMKQTEVHSIFTGPLAEDGLATSILNKFTGKKKLRTQDLDPEYTMNVALYLIEWDAMKTTGAIYGTPDRTYGLPMERAKSVEIDTHFDLQFAEFMISQNHIQMSFKPRTET
jgi:CMP-N-acetylneuraminic acid synthetase